MYKVYFEFKVLIFFKSYFYPCNYKYTFKIQPIDCCGFISLYFRFSTLLSIIIFSLEWKLGILISITTLSFIIVAVPTFIIWYGSFCHNKCMHDRILLFLPIPAVNIKHISFGSDEIRKEAAQARMRNKVISFFLILLVLTLQILEITGVIQFPHKSVW